MTGPEPSYEEMERCAVRQSIPQAEMVAGLLAASRVRAEISPAAPNTAYRMRALEARKKVAKPCLEGANQHRAAIAAEIIAGKLWKDGQPRTYWHCLATFPPNAPSGRRGQWKVSPPENSWETACWDWQDWGPVAVSRRAAS